MADVELVIKIPEEKYQGIINRAEEILDESTFCSPRYLYKAVLNGTLLPKGHGRLIDVDEYKEHLYACETNGRPLHIMELDERLATIDNVPIIIEADTESGDKE